MDVPVVNKFRLARGRLLRRQIDELAAYLGRSIVILDVGGRPDYWKNVGLLNVNSVRILNIEEEEFGKYDKNEQFSFEIGDACSLSGYGDRSVDLVHSNSVIEHVGAWPKMAAMAGEVSRVGLSGWVQTPAWSFPIEPHFQLPFLHWFAPPIRRAILLASNDYRHHSIEERRFHVDRINLLSYREFKVLFPTADIFVERLLMAKSYTARWYPQR